MYGVIEYSDCRKEQGFEIILTTDDVEYAKKVAFQNVKKNLHKDTDDSIYKITTKMNNEYLRPINKIIIAYKIINVEKYGKGFKIQHSFSTIYAVIELGKNEIEEIEEIDNSLICDNYFEDGGDEEEEEEEEEFLDSCLYCCCGI